MRVRELDTKLAHALTDLIVASYCPIHMGGGAVSPSQPALPPDAARGGGTGPGVRCQPPHTRADCSRREPIPQSSIMARSPRSRAQQSSSQKDLVDSIERKDGQMQVTYNG